MGRPGGKRVERIEGDGWRLVIPDDLIARDHIAYGYEGGSIARGWVGEAPMTVIVQVNCTLEMLPDGSVTRAVTSELPLGAVMVPLIRPVVALTVRPAGRFVALKVTGDPTAVSCRFTTAPEGFD